jgi:hypothetical protein
MTVARGSPVRIFQYRETRMGHKTILSAEGCLHGAEQCIYNITAGTEKIHEVWERHRPVTRFTQKVFGMFPSVGWVTEGSRDEI